MSTVLEKENQERCACPAFQELPAWEEKQPEGESRAIRPVPGAAIEVYSAHHRAPGSSLLAQEPCCKSGDKLGELTAKGAEAQSREAAL